VTVLSRLDPNIQSLRDVSEELLTRGEPLLQRETFRRCRHVVREIGRTIAAISALKAGNFPTFGDLMKASHASLRDDYEVSCPELDAAVEVAENVPGVYGARMTGGGFGGSAIALTEEASIPLLVERVELHSRKEFGIVPKFLIVKQASDGVCEHALRN
jgi:galactokinase